MRTRLAPTRRHSTNSALQLGLTLALVPLLASGCFFKLPETPALDIPQLQDEDLVPIEDFRATEAVYDKGNTGQEMIWLPDDLGGIDWAVPDTDVLDEDGLVQPDTAMNFDENCPYLLTSFTEAVQTASFLQLDQSLVTPVDPSLPPELVPPPDKLYVYYLTCGLSQSSYSAERGYAIRVEEPAVLAAHAECSHSCYIYLYKDGCNYNNLVSCWYQGGSEAKMTLDVLPGLYLVVVEFIADELWDMTGMPDYSNAQFDLHVALNRIGGQTDCQSETSLVPVDSEGLCDESGGASWELTAPGVLSPEVGDEFDLGCAVGQSKADPLGGMPDQAHALTIPSHWTQPALVEAELTFPDSAQSLSHIFAVTSAPCGAQATVIDCIWGPKSTLIVPGILALPGETLFAVVDGVGKDAFDAIGSQPYTITWRLSAACPE